MRVTFEEVLSREEWLHKELLNSLPGDVIQKAAADRFYDVKLVVNGVEIEPTFYNHLVTNIAKYVDEQAKSLVCEKLQDADYKARQLVSVIDEVKSRIIDEYKLHISDF